MALRSDLSDQSDVSDVSDKSDVSDRRFAGSRSLASGLAAMPDQNETRRDRVVAPRK